MLDHLQQHPQPYLHLQKCRMKRQCSAFSSRRISRFILRGALSRAAFLGFSLLSAFQPHRWPSSSPHRTAGPRPPLPTASFSPTSRLLLPHGPLPLSLCGHGAGFICSHSSPSLHPDRPCGSPRVASRDSTVVERAGNLLLERPWGRMSSVAISSPASCPLQPP